MSDICIITAVHDDELLKWGFEPARVAMPMLIYAAPEIIPVLEAANPSPSVTIIPYTPCTSLSVHEKLTLLHRASTDHYPSARCYYWADAELLYKHLVFEFVYSNILSEALERYGDRLHYFYMSGYVHNSFFGGPATALKEQYRQFCSYAEGLFEQFYQPAETTLFHTISEAGNATDLNLLFTSHLKDRIIHVIGDSHALFCFTLLRSIGCRSNILFKTSDISDIPTPYSYQFTHYMDSKTMHHMGKPDNLASYAENCLVKDGDVLVCVCGEVDVRSHVMKQHREHGRALDEILSTLAGNYIARLLALKKSYRSLEIVVFCPIPPLDNPNYSSLHLPVHGSIEERIDVTRRLNALLAGLCEENGFHCIDVADIFATEKGDLKWELSDQFCHISYFHHQPILDRLYNLFAR